MAAATSASGAPPPPPRIVPGAPPPSAAAKKAKKRAAAAAAAHHHKDENGNGDIHEAATAAALMSKAPGTNGAVDQSVEVHAQELDEEASKVQPQSVNETAANKSPLQAVLAKRIKVLNKKLQRIATYDTTDLGKLNADQQRAFASKAGIEMSVAELGEALKGVQLAEAETKKQAEAQQQTAVEEAKTLQQTHFSHLFDLIRLYHLFTPSAESFAPSQETPRALLEQASGQDRAAVCQLYFDFAATSEVIPTADKFAKMDKLAAASSEQVIEGISYARIQELFKLIAEDAVVEETKQSNGHHVEEAAAAVEDDSGAAAPGGILFMQASEIEEKTAATTEQVEQVEQAEPEGGAVESVPAALAVGGGATDKGESAAKGEIIGEEVNGNATTAANADGTAKAEVSEPINTTLVGETNGGNKKTAAELFSAGPRTFDWAAADDDDDLDDLDLHQPGFASSQVATPEVASTEATPVAPIANDQTDEAKTTRAKAVEEKQKGGQQQQRQGKTASSAAPVVTKKGPEVDEDGFVVASSKRTKMLQERMERGANGGSNGYRGGGRGGANGANGRGGGERRGGGHGVDRRARVSGGAGNGSAEGAQGKSSTRGGGAARGGRNQKSNGEGRSRGGAPASTAAAAAATTTTASAPTS